MRDYDSSCRLADRVRVVGGLGEVGGDGSDGPAAVGGVVELSRGEGVQPYGPDLGEAAETAVGLVEVLRGEWGEVGGSGDRRGVPVVGDGGPPGEPGLHL